MRTEGSRQPQVQTRPFDHWDMRDVVLCHYHTKLNLSRGDYFFEFKISVHNKLRPGPALRGCICRRHKSRGGGCGQSLLVDGWDRSVFGSYSSNYWIIAPEQLVP